MSLQIEHCYKNKAELGAYNKGFTAARHGETDESNPYKCVGGSGEFLRARFRHAWYGGWCDAHTVGLGIVLPETKLETHQRLSTSTVVYREYNLRFVTLLEGESVVITYNLHYNG